MKRHEDYWQYWAEGARWRLWNRAFCSPYDTGDPGGNKRNVKSDSSKNEPWCAGYWWMDKKLKGEANG